MTKELARSGHCKVPGKPNGSMTTLLLVMGPPSENMPARQVRIFVMLFVNSSDGIDEYQIKAGTES